MFQSERAQHSRLLKECLLLQLRGAAYPSCPLQAAGLEVCLWNMRFKTHRVARGQKVKNTALSLFFLMTVKMKHYM